jgi:hypothetical protein
VIDPAARALDLAGPLAELAERGYARLGRVLSADGLAALRERADDLMLARVPIDGFFFQLDGETGSYDDLRFGRGWEGPSLAYRKIERLEREPRFRDWLANPVFEAVARAGIAGPVAVYRACLMIKSAAGGTELPWHQDGGRFWGVDRDPTLQIWTALDDAPREAGCVEVVPGSHRAGLASANGGFLPAALTEPVAARAVALPCRAGEVLLLHNHVWHRSGRNATGRPRRAFSVCYMSAATRCLRTRRAPRQFTTVFA